MNVSIIVVARQPEQLVDDSVDHEETLRQIVIQELVETIDITQDSADTFIHEGMKSYEKENIRDDREINAAAHRLLKYYTTRDEYNSLIND